MSAIIGPRKLLCKWYHYTRCYQNYWLDQTEAWKEHVLSHYHDDATLLNALDDKIPCWIFNCPTTFVATSKADRKDKFLDMMDHVYEHMSREDIDHSCLNNNDHFTVVTFWKDIEEAYESGSGLAAGEVEFLYTEHVRPRGVTWSWAAERFGEMKPKEEDTGRRSDLEPYDKRKEERERKRLAREAKTQGESSK